MKLLKLAVIQITILSILLGLSVNLYPNVLKVKKSKPKKSKTEQQIWYEMQDKPTRYKYAAR